jgi:hypothetical protein
VARTADTVARLGGVMALVAQRAQEIVRGDGAVVDLPDGDDMVYSAATGLAGPHLACA